MGDGASGAQPALTSEVLAIVISARRPLVRIAGAACLIIGLTGGLSPALAAKRIELYDAEGQAWTYTNPEPLTFVRARVTVESVTGELAVLSTGPNVGETVVTVGAAELYGSEEEFEEE